MNYYKEGYKRGLHAIDALKPERFFGIYRTTIGDLTEDQLLEELFETEANDRQFTPFEFFASELNSLDEEESDAAWETFERGVSDAILSVINEE